jgi:hypothetical protein
VGRKTAVVLVLALVVVTGCGDGGGVGSSSTTSRTFAVLECPDPIAIASTEDVVAVLAATSWEGQDGYTSGPLPITPDLVIAGTVVLEAGALPIPQNCLDRSDCSAQGGFRMSVPVPGVVAEGDPDLPCDNSHARLTLTDTTVRLRPYLRDTHPCQYNFVPAVAVVLPCGTPCGDGQALCPVDGVCYDAGTGFCQMCGGGSAEACACQGAEGPLEEGASCSFWVSGDVQCVGTCRQGTCESADSLCS